MILRSVRLRNIRSYEEEKIEFEPGRTLLSGDIGSGKSSILLAIEFALFGTIRGTVASSSLLRNGAADGEVILDFEVGDKSYALKRTLKRTANGISQGTGYLITNGVKAEYSPVELKSRVLDILGYPAGFLSKNKELIFRFTVYTPQEEMKQILLEPAELRVGTLRRVFGIDKYKTIREGSEIFVKDLRQKNNENKVRLESLPDKQQQAKSIEERISGIQEKKKILFPRQQEAIMLLASQQRVVEGLEARSQEAKNILQEISLTKRDHDSQISQRGMLIKDTGALQQEILELEQKLGAEKYSDDHLGSLRENIQAKEKKVQEYEKKRAHIIVRLEEVKRRIPEIQQEARIMNDRLVLLPEKQIRLDQLRNAAKILQINEEKREGLQKDVQELHANISVIQSAITKEHLLIEQVRHLDECPTCKQTVSTKHKEDIQKHSLKKIDAAKNDLLDIRHKHDEQETSLRDMEAAIKELQAKQRAFDVVNVEVKQLGLVQDDLKRKNTELHMLIEKKKEVAGALENITTFDYDEFQEELSRLRKQLLLMEQFAEAQKELEKKQEQKNEKEMAAARIQENINALQEKLTTLESASESMEGVEEELSRAKALLQDCQRKVHALDVEVALLEKEVQTVQEQLLPLKEEIAKLLCIQQKMENVSQIKEWTEKFFIKLMESMEKQVMASLYHAFNEVFCEWFSMLIDDPLLSVRLDEEFGPVIEQNGYETEYESLSGGEKTSLALAYRLSLNKIINDLVPSIKTNNLIILDEPTDGFSTEQLDKVRDVLAQLDIPQIIIVSHEQKVEGFVDRIIKIRKNDHVSSMS